jgi:Trk-type K+ transport system membrane component
MKPNLKLFKFLEKFAFTLSALGLIGIISDFGFYQKPQVKSLLALFYLSVLAVNIVATIGRYFHPEKKYKTGALIFDILALLFSLWVIYHHFENTKTFNFHDIFYDDVWLRVAVALTFIRDFSELRFNYKTSFLNPAQLFISSFILIILGGSILLMLPTATHEGISFIDALFTSTSAVCVTGLIVVDTATYFTDVGKLIIMGLFQIGGLGILTFASYFSYFFKGGATYENQMVLTDVTSSQKIGEVFSTLKNILLITLIIEGFSALFIFISLDPSNFSHFGDQVFFSLFHAVSAFCNAGFSTLTDSIYDSDFRFNYPLQLILMFTFIFGGLGFPIVANSFNYISYTSKRFFLKFMSKETYRPWVLNINSRITLITTFSISSVAIVMFYIMEYKNTLAEHNGVGKIITAMFSATTPRTAGFNVVDMNALNFSTIMLIFLLMWIGASPASTGGGIKTSTFAIATLNILSLAQGKTKIEIFRRQIADISVRRAFAIISLSLIAIGFSVILLSFTDADKDLLSIGFEAFSAYSTVGLSLGITGDLSEYGKIIIVGTMFVGRVTLLTVIIAFFKKVKHIHYQYPTEEITMN